MTLIGTTLHGVLRFGPVLLLLWGGTGQAEDIQRQLRKEKQALEQIRRDMEEKQKATRSVLKQALSARSALAEADRKLGLHEREVGRIGRTIQGKDAEQRALSEIIRGINQDIQISRSVITKRLRTLYKEWDHSLPGLWPFFQHNQPIEQRLYALRRIAEKEEALLSRLTRQRVRLRGEEVRLADASRTLKQEREALSHTMVQMREDRRKKDRLLARIEDEKASHQKEMLHLEESATRLQALVQSLEAKKKDTPVVGQFSKKKGQLAWPNDGQVAALFGRQKHPLFDTYVNRHGINIAPSKTKTVGVQVQAVSDGLVIYANGFRGYDRVVMIDHGENYYSVYAHLTTLWVAVGDRVRTGRPIGEINPKNDLYFEIRHEGKPLDPLPWLQKRG